MNAAESVAVENVSLVVRRGQGAARTSALTLRRGEITALVGDNGAGKSTLVRCISGIHRPTPATIAFDGDVVQLPHPRRRPRGRHRDRPPEPRPGRRPHRLAEPVPQPRDDRRHSVPFRLLDRRGMKREADRMVSTLAVNVPAVTSRVRRLSGGQRQAVSICRAAGFSSKLVIMDEPTAALGVQETAKVEELIRKLRDDGHAVLLISHNFEQVMRLTRPGLGHARRTLRRRTTHRRDHRRRDRRPDHRRHPRLSPHRHQLDLKELHCHVCTSTRSASTPWSGSATPHQHRSTTAITSTKEAGFDLLELSLHDSLNLDVAAARAELDAAGLQVACSRGLAFDADVSSEDPDAVDRGAEAAAPTRCRSPMSWAAPTSPARSTAHWASTARPLSAAGRANVVAVLQRPVAIRPPTRHDPRPGDLQPLRDQRHQHRRRRAAPRRRHRRRQRPDPPRHLPHEHRGGRLRPAGLLVGDRLGYVHIGENHRGYLGSGHLDFASFFRALDAINYTGPITFEASPQPSSRGPVQRSGRLAQPVDRRRRPRRGTHTTSSPSSCT